MKFQYFFALTVLVSLVSCGGEPETQYEKPVNDKNKIVPIKVDYLHIITEAMTDYPTTLRSDTEIEIYDRDVMEIKLDKNGNFTIDDEKSDWEELDEQVHRFFKMNRELRGIQTASLIKNKSYAGIDCPFYTQFTRESYQGYIDRLTKMAETDKKAELYLLRHARSIKAFDAVEDKELSFINPNAIIRYVYADELAPEKLTEFEEALAKIIVDLREDLAIEKFQTNYETIRLGAYSDGDARRQLLFLQEMFPAYLLKMKESELEVYPESDFPELPQLVPPPLEEIVTEENKEEEIIAPPR